MVSTCHVDIPALPPVVTISGSIPVGAVLAYATTHTNYFGGTSCGLSSLVAPTPSSSGQASTWAKCTVPASVSGKAYAVTPVIWVPQSFSSTIRRVPYDCDPIPAASLNAGKFKFGCPSLLPGKSMGSGRHSIDWVAPTGGPPIDAFSFFAVPPSTTPTYVANPSLAKTNIVPKTIVPVTATTSTTYTRRGSTSIVRVTSGTSTCTATVVASVSASASATAAIRARDDGATLVDNMPEPGPAVPTALSERLTELDGLSVAVALELDSQDADDHTVGDEDGELELKQRDEDGLPTGFRFKRALTIGRPDYTYPPYGSSIVYVSSISTSTWTNYIVSYFTVTASDVTTTAILHGNTIVTVTILSLPTPSTQTSQRTDGYSVVLPSNTSSAEISPSST